MAQHPVFQAPEPADQSAGRPRASCAGPSLLDLMWGTLLAEMHELMPGGDYAVEQEPVHGALEEKEDERDAWFQERARLQGACQGITACIALVMNPYYPDLDAVRQEALTRWTAEQAAGGAGTYDKDELMEDGNG